MTLPKSPSFRLDGRPVLVTGASSGIGAGCVALGEMGAQVTIVARGQEKLDALAEAMRSEGHQVSAVALDISDVTAVQALCAEQAASNQGPFRAVVNSAGLARHTPSLDTNIDDFDAVMSLNVRRSLFFDAVSGAMLDR